ncbi:MAG: hypothetical protein E7200_03540 [Selenomonas ruminantium]|nr:hypothetical protein [Selenomonas ruminantium]
MVFLNYQKCEASEVNLTMKMDVSLLVQPQSAAEYLQHAYEIPQELPQLPLPDEPFVTQWQEAVGKDVLDFMAEDFSLPVADFSWEQEDSLRISFVRTLGGRLPVIATESHEDFRGMEALLNGRAEKANLPLTVNAFTIKAKAENIFKHCVLLLNRAPYSNIPARELGLEQEEWLERSHRLRTAHECGHYETLRLFGGMKNNALDEILADALGQIAAFGDFDADRQRLFFGLKKGGDTCTGRLTFYCQKVAAEERPKIYKAVNEVLDEVAAELKELRGRQASDWDVLAALAGKSIAGRLSRK